MISSIFTRSSGPPAERLRVAASMVIEPVNGAARNAERLARPDIDWLSVNRPGQHSVDAVNCLLILVVAVGWTRKAVRCRNRELKCRDAAGRVVTNEQEAHGERPDTDGFIGRINAEANGLLCHVDSSFGKRR